MYILFSAVRIYLTRFCSLVSKKKKKKCGAAFYRKLSQNWVRVKRFCTLSREASVGAQACEGRDVDLLTWSGLIVGKRAVSTLLCNPLSSVMVDPVYSSHKVTRVETSCHTWSLKHHRLMLETVFFSWLWGWCKGPRRELCIWPCWWRQGGRLPVKLSLGTAKTVIYRGQGVDCLQSWKCLTSFLLAEGEKSLKLLSNKSLHSLCAGCRDVCAVLQNKHNLKRKDDVIK